VESAFRDTCPDGLKVIETLGYAPGEGAVRGALHLERMAATCARLGIAFDGCTARAMLSRVAGAVPLMLRLTVARDGELALETSALRTKPSEDRPWRLAIAPQRLCSDDPWLRVKTTRRGLYDRTRAGLPAGTDEMLFLNERGELCEGTITTLFLDMGEETGDSAGCGLLTPDLASGLLPGVLRRALIEAGRARSAVLDASALEHARALYVGNSLRGLMPAELA